jgi:hypothetical protein
MGLLACLFCVPDRWQAWSTSRQDNRGAWPTSLCMAGSYIATNENELTLICVGILTMAQQEREEHVKLALE